MIPFNYHHLYYFYVIAKSDTLTKACEKLYLAQSTLSTQLSLFEKSIHKKLFHRHKQRLVLTEEGRLVLDYAESIFEMGQELQDALRDRRQKNNLAIQIGVLNGTPKAFSHSLIESVYKFMPQAYVHLTELNLEALLKQLQDHNLDVILTDVAVHGSQKDEIQNHLVARIPIEFVATKTLIKNIRSFPRDLNGAPFILPSHPSQIRRQLLDQFSQWKINPDIRAEVQDVEVARRLALSGHGIVPLNAYTVATSLPKGGLVALPKSRTLDLYETVYLVTRKRKHLNPLAEYLVQNFKLRS